MDQQLSPWRCAGEGEEEEQWDHEQAGEFCGDRQADRDGGNGCAGPGGLREPAQAVIGRGEASRAGGEIVADLESVTEEGWIDAEENGGKRRGGFAEQHSAQQEDV